MSYDFQPTEDGKVNAQLRQLSQLINGGFNFLRLETTYAVPAKPRNGELRYADGTSWDPGSGEGFYGYEAGAWVKL